jgi:SAM-dependent methyltransferase
MIAEKSLFFYGTPYHAVIDKMEKPLRRRIVERVPEGATVLDLGCGTGELALTLRGKKNCRVQGFDLSKTMIDFAQKRNPHPDVTFELKDAVSAVQGLADDSFDVAVVSQLFHEITLDQQIAILQGVARVAGKALIADWRAPLSPLGPGAIGRLIEGTIGREHRTNFLAYLAAGGVIELVKKAGLGARVAETALYTMGVGQLVVLGRV